MPKNNLLIFRLSVLCSILAFGFSCKKDGALDVISRDRLSDATVWTDTGTVDVFLNDIYEKLPDGNNWYDPIENYSDNSVCGYNWTASRNVIQQASYNSSTVIFDPSYGYLPYDWKLQYGYIRKCNVFIQSVTASTQLTDIYIKNAYCRSSFLTRLFLSFIMDDVWRCSFS